METLQLVCAWHWNPSPQPCDISTPELRTVLERNDWQKWVFRSRSAPCNVREELGDVHKRVVSSVNAALNGLLRALLSSPRQAVLAVGPESARVAEELVCADPPVLVISLDKQSPQLWSRFDQCHHLHQCTDPRAILTQRRLACNLAWVDACGSSTSCSRLARGLRAALDLLQNNGLDSQAVLVCRFTGARTLETQLLLASAALCFAEWVVVKPLHVGAHQEEAYLTTRGLRRAIVPGTLVILDAYLRSPRAATLLDTLPLTAVWLFREDLATYLGPALAPAAAEPWPCQLLPVARARYQRLPPDPLQTLSALALGDPGYWCRLTVLGWQALCGQAAGAPCNLGVCQWISDYLASITVGRPGVVSLALPGASRSGCAGLVWAVSEGSYWLPGSNLKSVVWPAMSDPDLEARGPWLKRLLAEQPARERLLAALYQCSQPLRCLLPSGVMLVAWRAGDCCWVLDVLHWPLAAGRLSVPHARRLEFMAQEVLPVLAQPGALAVPPATGEGLFWLSLPLRAGAATRAQEWYPPR